MKIKVVALLTGALITVACTHKQHETGEPQAMPVEVSAVQTDSLLLYREYPGSLIANNTVEIVARVNGIISGALYKGGEMVHGGEVLFTIDPTVYQNAVTAAEAALVNAQSSNAYAEQHYEAVLKASKSNAVSQMEVAQALSDRDQSRAAISSAQAQLSDARTKLGYCTIRAPYDGMITTNRYSKGNVVSGEGAPVTLATLYDNSKMIAKFAIEDASFLRMFENPNNRDKIDYTAIPVRFSEKLPHDYTAYLTYLAPNVDPSTGTLNVEAHILNPHNELRAGMYCTISLPYKMDPEAILVRDASISTDQLGKYIYVVNDSNKVVYTPITVGDLAQGDTMRIVTKGLRPGQRYVTSAMLKVRDGLTVKPIER